jgi:hypothetical protein
MKTKDERWPDAHLRLKALYETRAKDTTQAEFGAANDIGTQGMVYQYLNGIRPLNFEAAAKFARGLGCTIRDISPEMADAVKRDIVPVLGPRAWILAALGKTAMLTVFSIPPLLHAARGVACVLCQIAAVSRRFKYS